MTNIGIRTLDAEGKELARSGGHPFFKRACLPTFLGGDSVVDKNLSFVCPPGFHNFVSPLRYCDSGKVLAYIILGPVVLVMRRPKEDYKKLAEELGVDFNELWDAVQQTRIISFHRAQSLVTLVRQVGDHVLKFACENAAQGTELVKSATVHFAELLKVLLDVAMQLSGADIGSIMFMDKAKKEMTIRAAQGLPENVVQNTRVKVGEGLCGTAVSENKPILIDEDVPADNRIARYLHRPYLKSSMILPIEVGEKVFGCLNLGALEVSPVRFNKDNLDSMRQLIDITTDALYTPLKKHIDSKADYFEQVL